MAKVRKKKTEALLQVNNKQRKRILVLNHIPGRDHLPDASLMYHLQEKGHDVFRWCAVNKLRNAICMIKPNVVVFPEIRIEYIHTIAKQCKEWGIQVVVRRGEMGHSDETDWHPDFLEALYGRLAIYDDIDLELVWGPKFREMLIRDRNAPPKKIKVVGAPFDHYVNNADMFKSKPKKNSSILIAGGFGYADLDPRYAIPEAKSGSPIHAIKVQQHKEARVKFIQLIKLLSDSLSGQIHVRVHPGEKEGLYINELDGHHNVFFCASEFPIESLRKTDLIIHSGSTMGYEAHLLGKPGINYFNFCKDKAIGGVHPYYDDPFKLINDIPSIDLTKSNAIPEGVKHIEDNYFYKVDGKFGKRAAKCIDVLPDNNVSIPDNWPENTFVESIYRSVGTIPVIQQWQCSECNYGFFTDGAMYLVKCPCCGIACCKTPKADPTKPVKGRFSDQRGKIPPQQYQKKEQDYVL